MLNINLSKLAWNGFIKPEVRKIILHQRLQLKVKFVLGEQRKLVVWWGGFELLVLGE